MGERRASGLNAVVARNATRLRIEANLTQVDVARRSGVNRLVIHGIENGSRIVGLNDLPRLCFALQCSLDDLLDGPVSIPLDTEEDMTLGDARTLMLRPAQSATLDGLLRRLIREEVRRAL
jgi:transcriptional regulator with XRE-family HTH domain